jgi:hypothetical protein
LPAFPICSSYAFATIMVSKLSPVLCFVFTKSTHTVLYSRDKTAKKCFTELGGISEKPVSRLTFYSIFDILFNKEFR